MRLVLLSSVLALGAVLAGHAFAGVEILAEEARPGPAIPAHRTIYLAPGRLRVETDRTVLIYRSETNTAIDLAKTTKHYVVVDPAEAAKIKTERDAMFAKLQAQLATLSEDDRKEAVAVLATRGLTPDGVLAQPPLVKRGESKTVGSWSCQVYRRTLNETTWADICIAPFKDIGLDAEDIANYAKLTGELRTLMPNAKGPAAFSDFAEQTKEIGFEGISIETATYADNKLYATATVTAVRHVTLADDRFDIPAGYTKKEIPLPSYSKSR